MEAATAESVPVLRGAGKPVVPATDPGRQNEEPSTFFAGFRLEADGTLWRGEAVVHLPPRELAALRLLLAHAGQVISPMQLRRALWGDVHVTADSVPRCLSSLRARLEPETCIQTVYKRGYRLSAEVRRSGGGPDGSFLRLAIAPFAAGYSIPEYLGQAIAAEITASLSREFHPAVAILARDSVFNLAQRGFTAQQIGQKLRANLVLTGTLRAFSSHCRLRAEMIRVKDDTQIWVEDMLAPRNRTDLLEQELMRRLAYRLDLGKPGGLALLQQPKQSGLAISASVAVEVEEMDGGRRAEAYEVYLRGRHEWRLLRRHQMQDGMRSLLRAIELDSSLLPAKIELAHLCVVQALYGFMSPAVSADLVHHAAESISDLSHRACALLPTLGWIHFSFDRNLSAALRAFSSSAHLPHDPLITRARVIFSLSRHRFAEAIELLRAALCADPFSPWLQSRLAWAFHLDGQGTRSVEQIRTSIALFPDHPAAGLYGAVILAFNGETDEGIGLARNLEQNSPYCDSAGAVYAYALACAGRAEEARGILGRLQWLGRERYISRGFMPAAYVALGEHEAALRELRIVEKDRCPWFFQMMADPRLKSLRGNPEFEQMRAILPAMESDAERDMKVNN